MTIALCLKVGDGVVLGADSASSMAGPNGGIRNVYFNAEKMCNLRKDLPIGCVTYGLGGLGGRSVIHLLKDLRRRLSDSGDPFWLHPEQYTMEEVATRLRSHMYEDLYRSAFPAQGSSPTPELGFILAGYSAGSSRPEVWSVEVGPDGTCGGPACLLDREVAGRVVWRGMPEALGRLLLGYTDAAVQRLVAAGVDEKVAREVLAEPAVLSHPAMPIQDGIDLILYLAEVTCGFVRFSDGAPSVAPPIDVAAVTRYEGFRWVRRKHYYPADLNPVHETDQVLRGLRSGRDGSANPGDPL